MPAVIFIRELEGIIDKMIEAGDSAADILDACQLAVIQSLIDRDKPVPPKIRALDFFRLQQQESLL